VRDGTETDVDCGGTCAPCGTFAACLANPDCASGDCDANRRLCLPTSCSDGVTDGLETDVDCGGICRPCALAQKCKVATDCASSGCDGVSFTCVANPCLDHVQDNEETDVDCGGNICDSCPRGKGCRTSLDCTSGSYCANEFKPALCK
jgi:hypothetical protein